MEVDTLSHQNPMCKIADEIILFTGPSSSLPTTLHLRVFEAANGSSGSSIVILSDTPENQGLPLSHVEEGIPTNDRHAVPSNLVGLAAVASEYSRFFWEGFLVLLELPTPHSTLSVSTGLPDQTQFQVRYWLGKEETQYPQFLSQAEVATLITPANL